MKNLIINKNIEFDILPTEYIKNKKKVILKKTDLNDGLNVTEDFFINKSKNDYKVFDRICDHNGGKLIYRKDKNSAICPYHNWRINPLNGKYLNLNFKKKEIKFKNNHNNIELSKDLIELKKNTFKKNLDVDVQFLNHASLLIKSKNLKFVTDPWFHGPAFNCGWWLKYPSPKNCYEIVEDSDFIFISHNHPDHLHVQTLNKISKNKKILTPNFQSKSTLKILKDLNFKNIELVDFDKNYIWNKGEIRFSFLKSGDFRDDSGIFLQIGSFSALLNVDCNNINFFRLPKKISLLASSFAGGASGYPLCFENISLNDKVRIVNQNRNVMLSVNKQLIKNTNAKFYLPYASFFQENATRDEFIKKNNKKNSVENYSEFLKKSNLNVNILNIENHQIFKFVGNNLKDKITNRKSNLSDDKPEIYIKKFKKNNSKISNKKIEQYFESSNFRDDLILYLIISNDDFSKSIQNVVINFSFKKPKVEFKKKNGLKQKNNKLRKLQIKVRKEALINTINNKLPWDDLLIGFQVRINRIPDVYNNNFWLHFSNIYIGVKSTKQSIKDIDCNICEKIIQSLNNR